MSKTILAAAAALTLTALLSAPAHAACSAEEAQQKALAFSKTIQEVSQKDPEKYAKVMQELQPELLQIQQKQDVDAMCAFYDKALERLK